jgi:hypothetical protein
VDQLASPTPGLIAQLRGIPTTQRYTAATVYVDHYSRLSFVFPQKSTNAEETIESKAAFERYAAAQGVQIKHYHADNGVFADNKWRQAVADSGQTLSFCGVNAHFQNGVAERRIRELQDMARTMLIHAHRRWPMAITANLWPYALRAANDAINSSPMLSDNRIPVEVFSGVKAAFNPNHSYPFGCPVYVLRNELQSGKAVNKWQERSRVGIYLGQSPQHARTVALVLSMETGLASPQFHVVMDPTFQTMREAFGAKLPTSQWQEKCHFGRTTEARQNQGVSDTLQQGASANESDQATGSQHTNQVHFDLPATGQSTELPSALGDEEESAFHVADSEYSSAIDSANETPTEGQQPETVTSPTASTAPASNLSPPSALRRSTRARRSVERLIETMATTVGSEGDQMQERLLLALQTELEQVNPLYVPFEALAMPETVDTQATPSIFALAASADEDTMYYHEAMKQPDKAEFLKGMMKEVTDQLENGIIEVKHISQVPVGARVLPSVWALKRKRRISTGEVYKWKARLNLDGSKQVKGVDYQETYAPVASWATIRLVLSKTVQLGWHTKQIDFVQAYNQADALSDQVYMKLPKGFEIPGAQPGEYVLHVKKNTYGGCDSGRTWNRHLIKCLKEIGFRQSDVDPCLLYRGTALYVLYTDDTILASPNAKELDKIVEDMRRVGLKLTEEGDLSDFLGVQLERKGNRVHMSQPHIIDQILKDVRLDGPNVKTKSTPAATSTILGRHLDSEPFDGHFNYRSVIGKLNFLERSTRPDIAVAVHQCARFQSNPRKEHGQAIMWLCRYLAGTKDKGIIFNPTKDSFECHVDADWIGNWIPSDAGQDPDTARSRTGFVISYAGCPILWSSRMQTQIALSTTESEYIALSTALREVIPIMEITKELHKAGFQFEPDPPKLHCKVFEDNQAALEISSVHKFRPRTKHINVQYHHFRSYVDSGEISIHPIDTLEQRADMLTKNVPLATLLKHRKTIQGW